MSDSSDTEVIIVAALLEQAEKERRKRRRKVWVNKIFEARPVEGEFHTIIRRLQEDPQKHHQYIRMSREKFNELLTYLRPQLDRKNTAFRRSISAEERLTVCLRYLATGDSFRTISFNYRLGHSTVYEIVLDTCEKIWETLQPLVMPTPTKDFWLAREEEFRALWNFPNCIAAIDGKHVVIQAPRRSGTLYFNYKKTFSIVLMAAVDANYRFVMVDVGSYGKNSDSSIFSQSNMGKLLKANKLCIPPPKVLPGTDKELPLVFVADEAFPLSENLMRPFPGSQLNEEAKKIFNYRLSRARRTSENAFGILVQRFRFFLRRLQLMPENAVKVILAAVALHNFLRPEILPTEESINQLTNSLTLRELRNVGGNATTRALHVRNEFKDYFMSAEGALPWQYDSIHRGCSRETL